MPDKIEHVGIWTNRLEAKANNPREVAFAEQWQKENKVYTDLDLPILQELFIKGNRHESIFAKVEIIEKIDQRDARIVATVMQWLGSNCGMSYLHESLAKCGYKIVKIPREDCA